MYDYAKDGLLSMQSLTVNLLPVPDQISESRDGPSCLFALGNGDPQMSYWELKSRADQFARFQVQNSNGSGGTVTICMERSFDWIVCAVGIMRTGCLCSVGLCLAGLAFALRG
jgi:acyl-coenzyme A synthetase/AMP-(fatty) acid ligase